MSHLVGLGGRDEHGLSVLWKQLDDLTQLILKPDLQDAVGFIDDQACKIPIHESLHIRTCWTTAPPGAKKPDNGCQSASIRCPQGCIDIDSPCNQCSTSFGWHGLGCLGKYSRDADEHV